MINDFLKPENLGLRMFFACRDRISVIVNLFFYTVST